MQYTTGRTGRVIVARLEHGDPIYACIETIARDEKIHAATVWVIGGIANAGVVVGPETTEARPPRPMVEHIHDAREIMGVGTLFEDAEGTPKLHMHAGLGRGTQPLVGCPRQGADCWLVDEVIILELLDITASRRADPESGFDLLTIGDPPPTPGPAEA